MAEQQLFLETDLIRQAQHGNSAAYGELYAQHITAIYHYILKRVGESNEAEDLTQTVFVKAWQALRDYQPAGAPFRAWLYRIAHNAVIDHYRTQRTLLLWDELAGMADPQGTPEMRVLDTERQETVRNAIATLRPTYQAVLVRRFLQNLDYRETADELGQQINHVRVLQHRALEALRRVLTHESALGLATVVTLLALLLGGKIVVAAEQALPGDRLYPMRTWVEETTLLLADDAADIQLHTHFAEQRITALGALYQQGRRKDMTTAIVAAAAHIRTAAAKFAVVAQTATSDHTALTEQFTAALQRQSATLHTLALAAPQTRPTLEPALAALTVAEHSLQPEDAGALQNTPTVTPTVAPTVAPTVTPTRILLPTPTAAVLMPLQTESSALAAAPMASSSDNKTTAQDPVDAAATTAQAQAGQPQGAGAEKHDQQATTNTLPHKPAPDLGAGQDTAPLVPTNAGPAVAGPEAAVSHTAINAPAVDIYAASEATLTTPGQNDAVSAPGHSGHAVPDLAADLAADLADAHEQQPQAESVHPQPDAGETAPRAHDRGPHR